MNFIELMNLIVLLWPYILQLLGMIEDAAERVKVTDEVTNVIGNILNGTIQVANAFDVTTALSKPLKEAGAVA